MIQQGGKVDANKPQTYNNSNFILLGLILEKVSENNFYEALKNLIFNPCGMGDSGVGAVSELREKNVVEGSASKYSVGDFSSFSEECKMIYKNALSAGGVFSTTADLDQFSKKLFSSDENSLLSKESKEKLLKGGFGLWTFSDENKKILDQTCHYMYGDIPGFHSVIAYYPQSDLSLIMLTSRQGCPYRKIALDLARIAMNKKVDSPGFKPTDNDLTEMYTFCGKFFCYPVEYEFKINEKSQLLCLSWGK